MNRMDSGIAKVGMRVMITGDHNANGFKRGEIVRIVREARVATRMNAYGCCWECTNGRRVSNVREMDMASISAKVV